MEVKKHNTVTFTKTISIITKIAKTFDHLLPVLQGTHVKIHIEIPYHEATSRQSNDITENSVAKYLIP